MAKSHGAKQQKRVAKQKAKRAERRSELLRRTSKDPTIRLRSAAKWPIVRAFTTKTLWSEGIGTVLIARQESAGNFVYGVYLVDTYCLGVKNAFWEAGSLADLNEVIEKIARSQTLQEVTPEYLVKIVTGAVDYARSFGFAPHPDYRHAAALLAGIDPTTCDETFTFGRDGKPFYIQGPHESFEDAQAITDRIQAAGGHYVNVVPGFSPVELVDLDAGPFALERLDDDDEAPGPDEWQ